MVKKDTIISNILKSSHGKKILDVKKLIIGVVTLY